MDVELQPMIITSTEEEVRPLVSWLVGWFDRFTNGSSRWGPVLVSWSVGLSAGLQKKLLNGFPQNLYGGCISVQDRPQLFLEQT